MVTLVVLTILIALLAVVLMQLKKTPAAPPAPAAPVPDLANLKVTEAVAGDVLSIAGAGDDVGDLDFTVDRLTRFETGGRQWAELSGPYRERRVALRVSGEDEVEAALQEGRGNPSLEDLGLAEEDLSAMDERQNTADSFEYDGRTWLYRRSREVRSWRDGQTQSASFYYWEFQERDGKRLLTIRKPEGEPFAVAIYAGIAAADVTVYRGARA
jgi:hypothetical protein